MDPGQPALAKAKAGVTAFHAENLRFVCFEGFSQKENQDQMSLEPENVLFRCNPGEGDVVAPGAIDFQICARQALFVKACAQKQLP